MAKGLKLQRQVKPAPRKLAQKTPREWLMLAAYTIGLLAWVGTATIASQLIVGYLMIWTVGYEALTAPVGAAVYSALSYLLDLGLIILVPAQFSQKMSREELGLKGWPTWTDIGLAPIGYIIYILLAAGLVALFSLFPWFNAGEEQEVGFSLAIMGVDRIIAFVTLVVVAPIAEEIVFRGWLYGKLRRKLSHELSERLGLVLAILLVSILFGIVHLQWNVGVNVFALSVVLCVLREFTGTIYAGILLHMLKNGVAFYLLYVLGA